MDWSVATPPAVGTQISSFGSQPESAMTAVVLGFSTFLKLLLRMLGAIKFGARACVTHASDVLLSPLRAQVSSESSTYHPDRRNSSSLVAQSCWGGVLRKQSKIKEYETS